MIDEIETFSKKNLYKKWGNPTESAEGAKEDKCLLAAAYFTIPIEIEYTHLFCSSL